jgi:hypothetical protein
MIDNGQHYYQIQQKNSLNSNNFHSSDMSLSQSSAGNDLSRASSASNLKGNSEITISLAGSKGNANGTPSFFKNLVKKGPLVPQEQKRPL